MQPKKQLKRIKKYQIRIKRKKKRKRRRKLNLKHNKQKKKKKRRAFQSLLKIRKLQLKKHLKKEVIFNR